MRAEWAVRVWDVTPKSHHIGSFDRVDLRIQDEADDLWAGAVNQVVPREIKRLDVLSVMGPHTLLCQK